MTSAHIVIDTETTTITVTNEQLDVVAFTLPCGATTLHRQHLTTDPPLPEELTNAIGEMIDHLDDASRELPALGDVRVISVSGASIVAIAAVEYGGVITSSTFELSRAAAEDVFRTLATESRSDRRHNPGLPSQLTDTIVGGCCALVALFRTLHLDVVNVVVNGEQQ